MVYTAIVCYRNSLDWSESIRKMPHLSSSKSIMSSFSSSIISSAGIYKQLLNQIFRRRTYPLIFFFTTFSFLYLKFLSAKIKAFPKCAIALAATPDFRGFAVLRSHIFLASLNIYPSLLFISPSFERSFVQYEKLKIVLWTFYETTIATQIRQTTNAKKEVHSKHTG